MERDKSQEDGESLRKPISLKMNAHPITGELGLTLIIGDEQSWVSFNEALSLMSNIQTAVITGIASSAAMSMLTQMMVAEEQASQAKKIYTP